MTPAMLIEALRLVRAHWRIAAAAAVVLLAFGLGRASKHPAPPPVCPAPPTVASSSSSASTQAAQHQAAGELERRIGPTETKLTRTARTFRPDGKLEREVLVVREAERGPSVTDQLAWTSGSSLDSAQTARAVAITPAPATVPGLVAVQAPRWAVYYGPELLPRPRALGLFGAGIRVAGPLWVDAWAVPIAPAAGVAVRVEW